MCTMRQHLPAQAVGDVLVGAVKANLPVSPGIKHMAGGAVLDRASNATGFANRGALSLVSIDCGAQPGQPDITSTLSLCQLVSNVVMRYGALLTVACVTLPTASSTPPNPTASTAATCRPTSQTGSRHTMVPTTHACSASRQRMTPSTCLASRLRPRRPRRNCCASKVEHAHHDHFLQLEKLVCWHGIVSFD